MVSVDGHDLDEDFGSGGRGDERNGMPNADFEDAKQGEVEVRELEREELGGEARAVEWALGPSRSQALGVVCVQVGQEVHLAALRPPVHRYQAFLHFCLHK